MIKRIITGVVILVLALLIFSYITDPSFKTSKIGSEIQRIKGDLKEGFENIELKGKTNNTTVEPIKKESREQNKTKEEVIPKLKEPSLLSKCKSDFNYYADISKRKYNVRVSIIEEIIVSDRDSIDKFIEIWGAGLFGSYVPDVQSGILTSQAPELNFPIVLFAIKFEGVRKGQLPMTIACDNEGKIMNNSRELLLTYGSVLSIEFD